MPFEAIFFDAGNTLLFVNPSEVLPIYREVGVDCTLDLFWEAEFRARVDLAKKVDDGASGTEAHMWQEYFAQLFQGCGVPREQLRHVGERVRDVHSRSHLWTHLDPATPKALGTLRAMGHRLAVISNADGRVEGLIQDAGIHDFFEFILDSAVEGVEKPDPEIFLRACRRMGVEPRESLYVGDLYPVDVKGARSAGMEALLLDPMGRLDYPVDRIPNVAALPAYLTHRRNRLSPQA